MSEMPDRVWVYNRNGALEVRDVSIVVGNIEYIRADIADQLAEALEYVAADMNDSMPIPSDVILMAREALATYRKAKEE